MWATVSTSRIELGKSNLASYLGNEDELVRAAAAR